MSSEDAIQYTIKACISGGFVYAVYLMYIHSTSA